MSNIPIFFASDDNYSGILSISISSICYNTKNFINFYVLDGGIAEFHKKQIESLKNKFNNFDIEFIKVNTEEKFKNFKTTEYFPSLSTYSRFLIANIKPEFDKVLYLDCDTIILDDISKLYNEDLENYIIGAVPEHSYFEGAKLLKENIKNSKNHLYFNAGVLLINCDIWRKENTTDALLKIQKEANVELLCLDQDILNIYFDNNYKALSFKYNLKSADIFQNEYFKKSGQSEYVIEEIEEVKNNPIIKHFNYPDKAWTTNKGFNDTKIKFFEDFWFFAKMTPFYEGLLNNFNSSNYEKIYDEICLVPYIKFSIKLFNIIPIIKIKSKKGQQRIYLFNFIPLFSIKEKMYE